MKSTLYTIALFLISLSCAANPKPNIIVLLADDMGYGDLGSYGNPYIRTPNLDRLALEGQRWTDFYVASPVCSPSRGALLTGMVPARSGLYGNKMHVMFPDDMHGIPHDIVTLPEALKAQGYATGIFGKWHLGDSNAHYPTRHGFDEWYGIPYSNDMMRVNGKSIDEIVALSNAGKFEEVKQYFIEGRKLFEDPKSEYWNVPLIYSRRLKQGYDDTFIENSVNQEELTKNITNRAIEFIRQNKKQPFFVYVPYAMPHLPIFRSKKFENSSLRGRYGDAVAEIDWSAGKIRDVLDELNLSDNTIIIFSSDNGPWKTVSTFEAGSAGPLKGSKATALEGGVRVPGIFWGPKYVSSGVVSGIGALTDLYATLMPLVNSDLDAPIDSVDLSGTLLRSEKSARVEFPYFYKGKLVAYRKGQYKVLFYRNGMADEILTEPELYDLYQDVSELKNIAKLSPEILENVIESSEKFRKTLTEVPAIFDLRFNNNSR